MVAGSCWLSLVLCLARHESGIAVPRGACEPFVPRSLRSRALILETRSGSLSWRSRKSCRRCPRTACQAPRLRGFQAPGGRSRAQHPLRGSPAAVTTRDMRLSTRHRARPGPVGTSSRRSLQDLVGTPSLTDNWHEINMGFQHPVPEPGRGVALPEGAWMRFESPSRTTLLGGADGPDQSATPSPTSP